MLREAQFLFWIAAIRTLTVGGETREVADEVIERLQPAYDTMSMELALGEVANKDEPRPLLWLSIERE